MDAKRIEELLLEGFEQAAIDKSKSQKWVYKKLKTFSIHDEAVLPKPYSFAEVIDILCGIGTFAEVDYERGRLVLLTRSGFMSMNPAVVELSVSGGVVYADAHAKEGLIKQNTSAKAIEKVFNALFEN